MDTLDTMEGTWWGAAVYSSRGSDRQLPPWCSRLPGRHWSIKVVSVTAAAAKKKKKRDLVEQAIVGAAVPPAGAVISHPPLLPYCPQPALLLA